MNITNSILFSTMSLTKQREFVESLHTRRQQLLEAAKEKKRQKKTRKQVTPQTKLEFDSPTLAKIFDTLDEDAKKLIRKAYKYKK